MATSTYRAAYLRSIEDPAGFWGEAALGITWDTISTQLVTEHPPSHRWFADGRLNTCFNAVDRHVAAGQGDGPKVIVSASFGIEPGRVVE